MVLAHREAAKTEDGDFRGAIRLTTSDNMLETSTKILLVVHPRGSTRLVPEATRANS